MGLFDVAEDAASADRGELLIVTDQPDTRASIDGELHGRVEGEGVGHAGFVDDHQSRRTDRTAQSVSPWSSAQVSLASVAADPGCSARTAAAAADRARPTT